MTTSNPQSGLPADQPLGIAPLLPARPRKAPARRNRTVVIALSAAVALVAAASVWWLTHGKKSSTASAAPAELTREPDPPVVPPQAREPLRPASGELPVGGSSLAASLEIIKRAAAGVSDIESTPPINPRVARWEVRFPPGATVETYGHELDALGIELGVIGGGDAISYAGNFSKQQPERRMAPGAAEHRAYLVWRSGALANLDAALLARAKVSATDRLVVHFLPPQLELDLMAEEREFAAPQDVAQVRRTAFALVPDGDSFKFRVAEQEYFSGAIKKYSQKLPAGVKPKSDPKAPAAKLP